MVLRERGALLGACGLILTGVVLSIMSYHYFTGEFSEDGVARSRTWWEIVLNGQVLALALMWFNYSDEIQRTDHGKRGIIWLRMAMGMLAVSVPGVILIIAVIFGWFEHKAPVSVVHHIFVVSIGFWLVTILVNLIAVHYSTTGTISIKRAMGSFTPASIWLSLPLIGVTGLLAFDWIAGAARWYYFVPVLCYSQAAMPFIERGFGVGRAAPE